MQSIIKVFTDFALETGFAAFFTQPGAWKYAVMIVVACFLLYLAIVKKFEPLLLLPIAFGMLLTNLPGAGLYNADIFSGGHVNWQMLTQKGGLIDYLYLGVKLGIYPSLIFLGVGAMTDFGPLIANPKSLLLGAAAQLGIFVAYLGARLIFGFDDNLAASIGIIGGADGPTAIFVRGRCARRPAWHPSGQRLLPPRHPWVQGPPFLPPAEAPTSCAACALPARGAMYGTLPPSGRAL